MKTNANIPMRKCIGCNESKPKQELIRVAYFDEELSIDKTGRTKGRGVYFCKNEECLNKAVKKNALQRSFKSSFDKETLNKLFEELLNEQE